MRYVETIIVGGGPAGSSCAWKLKKSGKNVLILDKACFPRPKLCAGWITSKVLDDLGIRKSDYPYGLLDLDVQIHIPLIKRGISYFPSKWDNYSIRRVEFDAWLLDRSGAECIKHQVKKIVKNDNGLFAIDNEYSCKYLVGAGGTACPVARQYFSKSRLMKNQLTTLEMEFEYPQRDNTSHLFFCNHGLPGYSWFVPKNDGFVNIGVGAISRFLNKSGKNIHDHWSLLLDDLHNLNLFDNKTVEYPKERGHSYYLNSFGGEVNIENCYVIGDAAGLATMDLGEGIGPAIESALMVAGEIIGEGNYQRCNVSRYSLQGILKKAISGVHRLRNETTFK